MEAKEESDLTEEEITLIQEYVNVVAMFWQTIIVTKSEETLIERVILGLKTVWPIKIEQKMIRKKILAVFQKWDKITPQLREIIA